MTKAEIVQNLLDAHQITAEQAVVLLTNDSKEKQYIFIPQSPYPAYPIYLEPVYVDPLLPFQVTCNSTARNYFN